MQRSKSCGLNKKPDDQKDAEEKAIKEQEDLNFTHIFKDLLMFSITM